MGCDASCDITKCLSHADQNEVDTCFPNKAAKSGTKYTVTDAGEVILFSWLENTTCEGAASNQKDDGPTNTCYMDGETHSINALISSVPEIQKVQANYLV